MICYLKSCRFLLAYVTNGVANTHCVTSGLRTLEELFEDSLFRNWSAQSLFLDGVVASGLCVCKAVDLSQLYLDVKVVSFSSHGLRLVVRSYMVFVHKLLLLPNMIFTTHSVKYCNFNGNPLRLE